MSSKNQNEAIGRLLPEVTYFVRRAPYEATIPEGRQRWGSGRRATQYRQAFCSRLPKNDTAKRWAGTRADVLTCTPEVTRVRFIDYSVRMNHAVFQVAAEISATDHPIVVDLRDDTLLDLLQAATQETDQNGDIWYRGPFCWGLRGSQLILVRVGSWLHQSMQQGTENHRQRPVSMKDLESWRIYRVGVKRDRMVIPVLSGYYIRSIMPVDPARQSISSCDYQGGHLELNVTVAPCPVFLNYRRYDHGVVSLHVDAAYRKRAVFDCGDGQVAADQLDRYREDLTSTTIERRGAEARVSDALHILEHTLYPTAPTAEQLLVSLQRMFSGSIQQPLPNPALWIPQPPPQARGLLSLQRSRALTVAITVWQAV